MGRGENFGNLHPGRPKGQPIGRRQALTVLDKFLAEPETKEKLKAAFKEAFDAAPLRFFKDVVMPCINMLPKDNSAAIQSANSTIYNTDSVVYSMDKLTCELVSGHRLRIPPVTVGSGEN